MRSKCYCVSDIYNKSIRWIFWQTGYVVRCILLKCPNFQIQFLKEISQHASIAISLTKLFQNRWKMSFLKSFNKLNKHHPKPQLCSCRVCLDDSSPQRWLTTQELVRSPDFSYGSEGVKVCHWMDHIFDNGIVEYPVKSFNRKVDLNQI